MKSSIIFILVFGFILLSGFTDIRNPGTYLVKSQVNSQINGAETPITLYTNGTAKVVVLCPGTGVDCVLLFLDEEGESVAYASKKGKGKPDIQQ
jgi:hypothetical protein